MRRTVKTILALALAIVPLSGAVARAAERFSATAEFESERTLGSSRVTFELIVERTTPVAEARRLLGLLDEGGQGLLRSALAGKRDGSLRLGGLDFAVSMIVVTEAADGRVYSVLTDRPLRRSAMVDGDDAEQPFGVLRFGIRDGGLGEGVFHAATSLSIDEEGTLVVGAGKEPGRLREIRRLD